MLRMDPDAFVTRIQAAYTARVSEDVIKTWQYRGWIGEDGERRTLTVKDGLYRLGDVLDAERDTSSKPARSHRRVQPPELVA